MTVPLAATLTPAAWPASPIAVRTDGAEGLDLNGAVVRFGRDEEIFGEGEAAGHVYKVISGAVRAFRILADGRRQISEFYLPGDCFGLEAGVTHRCSAEALADTQLVVARRASLAERAAHSPELARNLWRLAVCDLQRSQDHVLMLGRRSAAERLASFIIDLARRTQAGAVVELPMSRLDIADFLGLTIETVSRTLTQFQESGLIQLASCRSVRLLDRAALGALCE